MATALQSRCGGISTSAVAPFMPNRRSFCLHGIRADRGPRHRTGGRVLVGVRLHRSVHVCVHAICDVPEGRPVWKTLPIRLGVTAVVGITLP